MSRTHFLHPNSSGTRCTPAAFSALENSLLWGPWPAAPPFLSYPAPRPQLLPRSSPARAAGPTRPPHFLQLSLAFALCFQALLLKILFSLESSPLLFRLFQKEQISLLSSLVTHLPLLLGTSSSKKEKKNIFFLPKIFPPFRITF